MIVELGHLALWLAMAAALVQFTAPAIGFRGNRQELLALARPMAQAQAFFTLFAFGVLVRAFLVSDFSVSLVATNSHTMKPDLYKWTGIWANHEGSLLLWVLVLALAGAGLAAFPNRLGPRFRARALSVMGLLALGFFAFLLLASNPFARISPAPTEGMGLNPLLQDPGLAFHPPLLYFGYVGLSVAFALSVAAMLEGVVGPVWAKAARPWVAVAWALLTVGIGLGSYWAYYELGWGGWWFWDPVENSALMPWIAGTALLHSIAVLAKRDALRNWTLLLGVLAFALSMVGTFIVRSGLLTSVHAFAVDPTRGLFLIALIILYVGGALAVYGLKAASVPAGQGFTPVSREGALVFNNLILSTMLTVVFVGTLYPMALEGLTGRQISVGPPYFNQALVPLILLMAAVMAVGPWLGWRRSATGHLARVLTPAAISAVVALALALFLFDVRAAGSFLGFGAALWLGVASVGILIRRGLTFGAAGMALAHLGVAVSILGVTASGALERETLVNMRVGDVVQLADWQVELVDVRPVAGPNWTAIAAEVHVRDGDRNIATVFPQSRHYTSPPMETTEAGIKTLWRGDIYAVLGKPDGTGRWQMHFWFKPLVRLIWAGGFLMALGGIMALGDRLRFRIPRRTPRAAFAPRPV
ncbi:MAG: heme lyase CcmF/NrfE family subunit [Sphingomonadaceae bacterium]